MSKLFARFVKDESGATAIEYGLIAALIALAIVVGAGALGNALNDQFANIATKLNAATPRDFNDSFGYRRKAVMTGGLFALARRPEHLEQGVLEMSKLVATFVKDESGATAIEYGLIVASHRACHDGRRRPARQLDQRRVHRHRRH